MEMEHQPFKRDFKDVVKMLGASAQFTPYYVVYNGSSYGCTGVSCSAIEKLNKTQFPWVKERNPWLYRDVKTTVERSELEGGCHVSCIRLWNGCGLRGRAAMRCTPCSVACEDRTTEVFALVISEHSHEPNVESHA